MILSDGAIRAMIEGMQRVRRRPESEWLEPVIQRLQALKPRERLTVERKDVSGDDR